MSTTLLPPQKGYPQPDANILLVDDTPGNLISLEAILGLPGYRLATAGSGEEALRVLSRQSDFAVIVLDVMMPGMDGFETARLIQQRETLKHIPIIFLTAARSEERSDFQAYAAGAVDFLTKPIDPVILKAKIAVFVELYRKNRELQAWGETLEQRVAERTAALKAAQENYRLIAENAGDLIAMLDREGHRLYTSPSFHNYFAAEQIVPGGDFFVLMHPDDRERTRHMFRETVATGQGHCTNSRCVANDGAVRYFESAADAVHDAFGAVSHVVVVSRDVTERKEHEDKIARLSRIYAVLSGINSAIVRIRDRDELFHEACRIAVTEGAFRMAWIGVMEPGTLDGRVVAWFGGEQAYVDQIRLTARDGTADSGLPACVAAREMRAVICNDVGTDTSLSPLREELLRRGHHSMAAFPLIVNNRTAAVLALFAGEVGFFDADELKLLNELAGDIAFGVDHIEKEERLNYFAYYDALTGIPNATLFHDRLSQFVQVANRDQGNFAIILIDLDRFTQLNDTLGRHVGDMLLRTVAERLKGVLREPYSLARISADTFAAAVANLHSAADAAAIVQDRIARSLSLPVTAEGHEIRMAAKAGIALYPGDGEDAAMLFNNAEAALKRAQSSGERCLYYSREINATVADKLALEGRLRQAVEARQFALHYQPKVDSRSGRVVGLEALIRWNDPERGIVPPGRFVPMLEETGLILEVGHWALCTALSDYRRWQQQGLQPTRIAVNVSASQFRQRDFAAQVSRAIEDSGTGSQALALEITESLLMQDIEANAQMLQTISDTGVTIAIDDFGTGYSSLRYLAKLPVDALKIDRAFVITMLSEPDSMAIVTSVISLAHSLELSVIAEGVDSEEQSKFLKLMKCDQLQGDLFSKPVPADGIAAMLASIHGLESRP